MVFEKRVKILKEMHNLFLNSNDENLYLTWIEGGVPDEPSKENYETIAIDSNYFYDVVMFGIKLIHNID